MGDRITTTEGLKRGDVVQVSVQLTDKQTSAPFWWKTFRVVMDTPKTWARTYATLLILKMHPDLDKDLREVDFAKDVVVPLEESDWPQGVIAMRMKYIHMGILKLGED